MKKKLIFICFFTFWLIQYGFGQKEWAPIGAKWFINSPISLGGSAPPDPHLKDYYTLESTKDTLVNSVSYRLIGDYLMRQEGGNIYYLYRDTLRLIYSFNVNVGDSLTFNMLDCFGNGTTLSYQVNYIDSVYVDNDTLKRIICETLTSNSSFPEHYEYIEKIGSIRTLIEDLAGCGWIPEYGPSWLRCYQDNDIFYKTTRFLTYGEYDCNYREPVSNLRIPDLNKINVYPNPTRDILKISYENHSSNLIIYDITGQIVLVAWMQNSIEINLDELQNGLFILNLITETGESYNKLIMKY